MIMMSEASNEKSRASQYSKQRRGMQVNVLFVLQCTHKQEGMRGVGERSKNEEREEEEQKKKARGEAGYYSIYFFPP